MLPLKGLTDLLTRVEEHGSLQVGVLLGADVHTPALPQEASNGLDVGQRHAGSPASTRIGHRHRRHRRRRRRRLAVTLGRPGEDPLQHAGLHRLRGLEVHAVLRQSQHQQGSPAASDQDHLFFLGQFPEARHVLDESQRLDQDGGSRFACHLRGAEDPATPRCPAGARRLLLLLLLLLPLLPGLLMSPRRPGGYRRGGRKRRGGPVAVE